MILFDTRCSVSSHQGIPLSVIQQEECAEARLEINLKFSERRQVINTPEPSDDKRGFCNIRKREVRG